MDSQPGTVTLLQQRRIEAAVIKPLVQAFEKELGKEKTREVLEETIKELAREAGREFVRHLPDASLASFARKADVFAAGGALEMKVLESTGSRFDFNVTRCRYAEMYKELGLDELGYYLSCNRDGSFVEGFSDKISLERTQTIMNGASHCDFRYSLKE